jgi:hypothetical protein
MTGLLRAQAFARRRKPRPARDGLTRPSWRPVPPVPTLPLN